MTTHIIMPTYNQRGHLGDAIEGIFAQTDEDWKLWIVNDGSTDGTRDFLELVAHPSVTVAEHGANCGAALSIDLGHTMAGLHWDQHRDHATWISSDNVMHPDWLETLAGEIADHHLVYSSYMIDRGDLVNGSWKSRSRSVSTHQRRYHRGVLVSDHNCCIGPSLLYKASLWLSTGPHRGKYAHDYEWALRAEEACCFNFKFIDIPLCDYRVHRKMATMNHSGECLEEAKLAQREARERRS